MAAWLDGVKFLAASNGTGTFTVSSAVTGYQTPASAGATNGLKYKYHAESADLTQWEDGEGVYTVSGTTLTRATVLYNSSGGTSAINFTNPPTVAIVALKEDLISIEEANSFTAAQMDQARANIGLAATASPTTPGTGKYAIFADSTNKLLRTKNDAGIEYGYGTLISNTLISASDANKIIALPSMFDSFELIFEDVFTTATAALIARTSIDGSTFPSSAGDYQSSYLLQSGSTVSGAINLSSATYILLSDSLDSGAPSFGATGVLKILPGGSGFPSVGGLMRLNNTTGPCMMISSGYRIVSTRLTHMQILATSSTLARGNLKLIGFKY